jgi:hypothetical protein
VPNVRAYDGVHSLLSDVLDAALSKYKSMVKTPITSRRMVDVGLAMKDRAAYDASGVSATVTPCTSITLTARSAAKIPLTGVSYASTSSTVSTAGGRTVTTVSIGAGKTITIPLPAC